MPDKDQAQHRQPSVALGSYAVVPNPKTPFPPLPSKSNGSAQPSINGAKNLDSKPSSSAPTTASNMKSTSSISYSPAARPSLIQPGTSSNIRSPAASLGGGSALGAVEQERAIARLERELGMKGIRCLGEGNEKAKVPHSTPPSKPGYSIDVREQLAMKKLKEEKHRKWRTL